MPHVITAALHLSLLLILGERERRGGGCRYAGLYYQFWGLRGQFSIVENVGNEMGKRKGKLVVEHTQLHNYRIMMVLPIICLCIHNMDDVAAVEGTNSGRNDGYRILCMHAALRDSQQHIRTYVTTYVCM